MGASPPRRTRWTCARRWSGRGVRRCPPRWVLWRSTRGTLVAMLALLLSVLATWSAPARVAEAPLNCPAGTARADRPDRPLALGAGRYAALLGRVPELADVEANGRRLGGTPLPAGGDVATRTLACDAGGRVAAAWVELTPRTALRIALREPGGALGAPVTIL